MKKQLRSHCPINFSLELIGDSWSLLIVRDIAYVGKKTFGEFLQSDEKIARNILADRLIRLQDCGIISKRPHPSDGRKDIYQLTERGIGLLPTLFTLADWATPFQESNPGYDWDKLNRFDRQEVLRLAYKVLGNGGSIFGETNSVLAILKNNSKIRTTAGIV